MTPSTGRPNGALSTLAETTALDVQGKPANQPLLLGRDIPNPFDKSNPKPKTPIIAGTVCGGVVLLAWIIGFSIYFWKRYRRKKRKRLAAEGKVEHPDAAAARETSPVVVPPDPAVLLGFTEADKAGPSATNGPAGHTYSAPV